MDHLIAGTILRVAAALTYALLIGGVSMVVGGLLGVYAPFGVGLVVVAMALAFRPLQARLDSWLGQPSAPKPDLAPEHMQLLGRELTMAVDPPAIARLLQAHIRATLGLGQVHLFLFDTLTNHFHSVAGAEDAPRVEVRFAQDSPLALVLARRREALYLGGSMTLPVYLNQERARLALLNCQVLVPLQGQSELIGWLALGETPRGDGFRPAEIRFVEMLADQAALALERIRVVADLERRVQEMNVLTRVAQGANVSVVFDDLLELVYAQTVQVIPSRDVRISLVDSDGEGLTTVFSLEDDDRVMEHENRPLTQSLELAVVREGRAILTDDYERESRSRGLLAEGQGIFAWIGAPLSAGADVIGVIGLGSRDASVAYSPEQRDLLQAIANQAAGALVKTRLLQETERRARQLATLNEIGRRLTSTLDPNALLTQILTSAVDILNGTAGSLLLVDQTTGELVFEVVTGPVAANLQGKRLPPGKGLVGEAVAQRQAIIANGARRRKEWFEGSDQQTGFETQDLLVTPMLIQERVIGALEVINKRDGTAFTANDQELLSTFTSQATIAIENARLYTLTDQALNARVEELSVLQRFGRELNASLDLTRILGITLEWACRGARASAGVAGLNETGTLRVAAAQGVDLPSETVTLTQFIPEQEIRQLQPLRRVLTEFPAAAPLLPAGQVQAVIPIGREDAILGLLVLESEAADGFRPDEMDFLARLSDQAALAVANAQLYDEVQAANLAKSKFVSFVAHELKNPMASIKGYTELVANGMAGPVNEMQSSFLGTVRSNVDRMNTIVSDLNDLTKIQVGSLRLDFKAVEVEEVFDEVVRSLRRQSEEKNQRLEISLEANLPPIWGDPLRLSQILTNLVSNAIKYTPKDGEIALGVACQGEGSDPDNPQASLAMVHFWVADHGIGIPLEDQDKIFRQYFRTDISKETASGTGLGLNITRSLVEMQGGRIWFESELEKGSTFHFTLPVAERS